MGRRWNPFGFQLLCFTLLISILEFPACFSLNPEGLALLEFQAGVESDPFGALSNWNPNDSSPCLWLGVHCVETEVQTLDLKGLSLKGFLAPQLGKLLHLRSIILYKNNFTGNIPKEIGGLTKLEVLDLRDNNFYGTIPIEIGRMQSLKRLWLCNNRFDGSIPMEFRKLNLLSERQCVGNPTSAGATTIDCVNRKFGHCIWQSSLKQISKAESFVSPLKGKLMHYFGRSFLRFHGDQSYNNLQISSYSRMVQNLLNPIKSVRRSLLQQQSTNLAAMPPSIGRFPSANDSSLPTTRSSGAFLAIPKGKKETTPPNTNSSQTSTSGTSGNGTFGNFWKYAIVGVSVGLGLLIFASAAMFFCQKRVVKTIGPWKTGLSGQLQKAFVTGVPKLNRSELETACEDFSNIIDTLDDCTVYKGTLSSGVEIAVASVAVVSSKEWPKNTELAYRKKIDKLSRVNHKNFVNLLGYCEENEPFSRMMVFEYAPNGTLFEHLHVKEIEHLDWNSRTRIVMGVAYCLQYMHHDLNPPVSHPNLNSTNIYLTDDYAAKIGEISFAVNISSKSKISGEDESINSELPPYSDPETNIYSFGILLLEIISGKLTFSEEQGSLVNWAAEYLSDKRSISYMIDPSLKSFKDNELDVICEVIQDCIQHDPWKRPTIKEVISKLRGAIAVSPDAATPRLSPLWWAELEILSVEAT